MQERECSAKRNKTTMGPNGHMSPSRQKKLKKNASARSFNPCSSAESAKRKELLKESQNSHSRAVLMMDIEKLKKRVDFNTRECKKCVKNTVHHKKPHHPTCMDANAWTPAAKEVLDAMTDWEKQKLNVKLGLLPRSVFKFKQPPPSTVAGVEATKTIAGGVEKTESPPLEVPPPQKLPPKNSSVDSISATKNKIQVFLFQDLTASLLTEVLPLMIKKKKQKN
jgi:hypothetical protein